MLCGKPMSSTADSTLILNSACAGDPSGAQRLSELVYYELRALAASQLSRERSDHTLQPTALIHEAYLKLVDQTRVHWNGRQHFLSVAAIVMRRILIDHARIRNADKRGGGEVNVPLDQVGAAAPFLDAMTGDVDVEALDRALKELAALDERQAKVVELRFFAGLDVAQTAEVLGVSERRLGGPT
jgi:RNA polymerase sigma-70 factor, ECF subfamily